MAHSRIAVIGTGAVGSTTVYALMLRNVAAEIIAIDANEIRCKGEILDLEDVLPLSRTSKITACCFDEARTADIIIITAGAAQKPGQSRRELFDANYTILESVFKKLGTPSPNTIIIIVTNPVDVMTYFAQKWSGLPRTQVFGTGTFLDTQRVRVAVGQAVGVAHESVHAYVIGEHGDAQCIPWSIATIGGTPLETHPQMTSALREEILQKTRQKAYEIIACKGATYYGIAACVAELCQNILFNTRRVVSVSHYLPEYNLCMSMPAVLGEKGVEKTESLLLNNQEQACLEKAAKELQVLLKTS